MKPTNQQSILGKSPGKQTDRMGKLREPKPQNPHKKPPKKKIHAQVIAPYWGSRWVDEVADHDKTFENARW